MKKLLLAAAAAAGLSASANAAIIAVLDDFSTGEQFVNQASPTSTVGNRTLDISNIQQNSNTFPGNVDPFAQVETAGGTLNINNGSRDDSTVDLSYLIGANADLAFTTMLEVVFANNDNALPTESTIEAFLDGTSLGIQSLPGSNDPFSIMFSLSDAQAAILAAGTTLRFQFNGSPDYDLSVDAINAVPEPGMIGLLGLGLLGLGVARRRKSA
jgi:opacity protein-like surface antigen